MDPANVNNLPEADTAQIVAEFVSLIVAYDETTTLAVKTSLRSKGYWVNQRDVSNAIWDFVNKNLNEYEYSANGTHRVYRYVRPTTSSSVSNPSIATPAVSKARQTLGTWDVYGRGGALGLLPTERYIVTTRNKARYEYSKAYDVPYVDTVAKRV